MGITGKLIFWLLLFLFLVASTIYLLRDRLVLLAAHAAGIQEYGADQLTWRSCKRLRLVFRKGAVRCVQLESAELLVPAAGRSVTRALWMVLRLVLAAVRGGEWAEPGRRPLLALRLQGLEVQLRPKAPRAEPSKRGGGGGGGSNAAVAATAGAAAIGAGTGTASEGGSSTQGLSPRSSAGGAIVSDRGSGDNAGGRRRRSRGGDGGAGIALPAPLLRLLPLIKVELISARVMAPGGAGAGPVGAGNQDDDRRVGAGAVSGGGIAAPKWEGRLGSLTVTVPHHRGGGSAAPAVAADGDDAEAAVGKPAPHDGGGKAAGRADTDVGKGGSAGATDVPQNAGGSAAAAAAAAATATTTATAGQANGQTKAVAVALVVNLTGLEAVVRDTRQQNQNEQLEHQLAATAAMFAGSAAPAALVAVRCGGLAVTGSFGRGRSPGFKPGTLLALATDAKEVHVDCRAVAAASSRGNNGDSNDFAAAMAAATEQSPLAAALIAVLTTAATASGRLGRRSTAEKVAGGSGRPGAHNGALPTPPLPHEMTRQGQTRESSSGLDQNPDLGQGLAERVVAWIHRLDRILPEKVSLRFAGVRAAATAVGGAVCGSAVDGVDSVTTAPSPIATLQLVLGLSSLHVRTHGPAVHAGSAAGAGSGGASGGATENLRHADTAAAAGTLMDASVQLGPVAALASVGGSAASAATAPLYFGMQQLSARVRTSVAAAAATKNPSNLPAAKSRYSLSIDLDLPATVVQLRPQMLLPDTPLCAANGSDGDGTAAAAPLSRPAFLSPPQLLQPNCYSLLLRAVAAKASCGFLAAPLPAVVAVATDAGPPAAVAAYGRAEGGAAGDGGGSAKTAAPAETAAAAAATESGDREGGPNYGTSLGHRLVSVPLTASPAAELRRQLQVRGSRSAGATAALQTLAAEVVAAADGGDSAAGSGDGDGGSDAALPLAAEEACGTLEQAEVPVSSADAASGDHVPEGSAPAAVPTGETGPAAEEPALDAGGPLTARVTWEDPAVGAAACGSAPDDPLPPTVAAAANGALTASATGGLAAAAIEPVAHPGKPKAPARGGERAPADVNTTASLVISLQGLEVYGSGLGGAGGGGAMAAAVGPAQAAAAPAFLATQAAGGRYDIVLLQRTNLTATAASAAALPAGAVAHAESGPSPPLSGQAVGDLAVGLGRLDVVLDSRKLTPLLRLAAHAKTVAAAVSRAASAAKVAAATTDATATASTAASGATAGSLLPASLLPASVAFTLPLDVLAPDDGMAGVIRFAQDTDGGSGLRCHRRGGGGGSGLGARLRVRSVRLDNTAGIRLALDYDMPLDIAFRPCGYNTAAPAAVTATALPTALEASLKSMLLAAWPAGGGGGTGAAESTVMEASIMGAALAVVRAPTLSAATAVAAQPPPSERQQALRIEQVKLLAVASAAAAALVNPATVTQITPADATAAGAPAAAPLTIGACKAVDIGNAGGVAAVALQDLLRIEASGTRGSVDMDVVLAALAAAQAVIDAAAAARREQRRQLLPYPRPPATGASAGASMAGAGSGLGSGTMTGGKRTKWKPLVEVRATDAEIGVVLGAAEVVTVAAAEARGSSGLRTAAVDALAVRVNGRRLLDVEYLTAGAAGPPMAALSADAAATGGRTTESVFTTAAAAAAAAVPVPAPGQWSSPTAATTPPRPTGSRRVSRGSVDMDLLGGDAVHSSYNQLHRRHHRRHVSGPAVSSGSVQTMGALAAAAAPPRPSAAAVQPWASLGRPPAWAAACTPAGYGSATAAAASTAAAVGTAAPACATGNKRGCPFAPKVALSRAAWEARRRAARERFELGASHPAAPLPDAGGGGCGTPPLRAVSVDVALYGATLTVSFDESAARVYVLTEVWSRAVKQVLGPRISRLKDALHSLQPRDTRGGSGAAASTVPAAVSNGSSSGGISAGAGDRRDKVFVEVLLDARRLAVVVEHQPLEAWMALHGSALRATATQRHLYERLMSGHVGSCAARGRRDVAAAVAGANVDATAAAGSGGGSGIGGARGVLRRRLGFSAGAGSDSEESTSSSSSGDDSSNSSSSDSSSTDSGDDDGGGRGLGAGGGDGRRRRGRREMGSMRGAEVTAAAAEAAAAAVAAAAGESVGGDNGGVQDEWAQVMRDVAATYIAACRAVEAAAAAAVPCAAAGLNGAGGATAAASGGSIGCGGLGPALAGCPGGALLHLSVAEAQAAIMVAPPGCSRGRQVAEAVILRLDSPASEGVTFERLTAISLAVAASELQVCLAGCGGPSSPALSCSQAAVSGWIIRARQLAAPPRTAASPPLWPVGRFHAAPVAMPLRFCRPNMKTYTDLRIEADGMSCSFGTAMEPVLAQLARAIKQRVVPPQPQLLQPDGSLMLAGPQPQPPPQPKVAGTGVTAAQVSGVETGVAAASPSGLPPWDNIRYVWRGCMKVMIRGLNAVAAASSLELPLTAADPRLALSAATLGFKISTGRLDVTATALAVLGFARGPGRGPGEPLVTVPLLSLPLLNTALHIAFKQRSATPYAFPLLTEPPPEGVVQDPVDVPGLMRSSSWSLALEVLLARDALAHLGGPTAAAAAAATAAAGTMTQIVAAATTGTAIGHPTPSAAAPGAATTAAALQQPQQQQQAGLGGGWTPRQQQQSPAVSAGGLEGLARAYIGEMQVKFIMGLVHGLASGAPIMTRGSWKRRTSHLDPPRPRPFPAPAATGAGPEARPSAAAAAASTNGGGGGGGVGGHSSLGTLWSRLDIDLSADVFDIVHDAQDPDDPSDLVCLRARNLKYANSFSYFKAVRTTFSSNGAVRTKSVARPVMAALDVEAYDIKIFMPPSVTAAGAGAGGSGGSGPVVAAAHSQSAAAAAAARRRQGYGGGGGGRGGEPPSSSAHSDPWDGAADAAIGGPGFGAGLIATCECLQLRQAPPDATSLDSALSGWAAGPAGQGQTQSPPQPRPIRIVVKDVRVLGTIDARDAVIATTVHIIQAFSRLPGSIPTRAASTGPASTSAAAAAASFGGCAAGGKGRLVGATAATAPSDAAPGLKPSDMASLAPPGASGGAGAGAAGGGERGGAADAAAGLEADQKGQPQLQQQGMVGMRTGRSRGSSLALPLRPAVSLRLEADPLAEPLIDPRVIADERALVAQLRQQNEARRAAARRRRLDRSSVSTASTAAATDPDPGPSLDSDSDEEGVLGSTLDPSDAPDRDAEADLESEMTAATPRGGGGAAVAGGGISGRRAVHFAGSHPAMRITYEVEFVRVQVGLISEYGGGGACLVLGADSAVLRGGRAPAALAGAAGTRTPVPAAAADTGAGSAAALKVLSFDVETLQAYATRQDQPFRESASSALAASGGGGGGVGCVRPSFSPLTDALTASAATAQRPASGAAAAAAVHPPRTADAGGGCGPAAAPPPVVWLQVVNGQLVPYGISVLPMGRTGGGDVEPGAAAAVATAAAPGIVMQKILNPFRIHLTSSRPWIPPPGRADAAAPPPPPLAAASPAAQPQQPQPSGGRAGKGTGTSTGASAGGGAAAAAAAAAAGSNGLKLDIDVPAITGQMESWQFQLLLAVINETLAAPLPKVVMLTRGSDLPPPPAVESSPEVAVTAEMLTSLKQQLRCMQFEALTLASYLTHGSPGFHDPYPGLAAAVTAAAAGGGRSLALQAALPHPIAQLDAAAMMVTAAPLPPPLGTTTYGGPYTATLFKPAAIAPSAPPSAAVVPRSVLGGGGGGGGAGVRGGGGAAAAPGATVPSAVLAQALLAPRPSWLNAMQLAALLRRNQELLLHWVLDQVSGAQDSLEAVAAVLVRLRGELATALEAQQQQRRKQSTAVAVRLGRFGWALVGREGAPFVQAELKGLSFHHSLDRDHTGTTKIVMYAADMWELRPTAGAGGGGPPPPAAAAADACGRGSDTNSILSLWRPDASSSWDDDPLLRMYVVHGGVDAQYVTYEHVEVYLHPLQVRLTYALAHVLMDYFELRDEEREEGGGKDEESSKPSRREKSKGSAAAKAVESSGAAAATAASGGAAGTGGGGGGGSTYTSPAKTGRSGGGWFSRRSGTHLPETPVVALSSSMAAAVAAPLAAGAAGAASGSSDPVPRFLPDPRQQPPGAPSSSADPLPAIAAATAATAAAATASSSPLRGYPPVPSLPSAAAATLHLSELYGAAAAAMPPLPAPTHGRQSRGSSIVTDEHAAAAAAAGGPASTDGAAVAAAYPAATSIAVRYGPTFRRRGDGRTIILVEVAGALVPTAQTAAAAQQSAAPATGRGARGAGDGASGSAPLSSPSTGTGAGGGGFAGGRSRSRAPRRLRFRHVRFNRIAARLTYSGPRLSIGSAGGWGLVIDARVYRNIVGGWRDILAKYKWDVIRSVIKSVAGIQASKLKELRGGGGGGSGASAASLLLGGAASVGGAGGVAALGPGGGLLAAGLSLEDLDPDITFTADGNALSAVTGGGGGGSGAGSGGGGFVFGGAGGQRAAALLGGVKKRAAAFMSAGGAAGARLRLAASGRPADRTTVGGGGQAMELAASQEEPDAEGEDAAALETADVVREMVRHDTAQEYERIKRAAAAAQARATRLAALVGDVPAAAGGGGGGAAGSMGGGLGGGGGGGGRRTYRF